MKRKQIALTDSRDISFSKTAQNLDMTRQLLPSGQRVPDAKVGKGWVITGCELRLMRVDKASKHRLSLSF